jgi:hypothetical protein
VKSLTFFRLALLSLSLALITAGAYGQNTFQRIYGFSNTSFLRQVIPVSNNHYLLCGALVPYGIYIMKVDSAGQILWSKQLSYTFENAPSSFMKCSDGGIVVCGKIRESNGNWDIFLLRTDSLGNLLWSRGYYGTHNYIGTFARQTNDGGFILCGSMQDGNTTVRQCLIKTNSNGSVQWSGAYSDTASVTLGEAEQVNELSDGYVLCGRQEYFGSTATNYDASLIRTDLLGNIRWAKSYGFGEWDQFNRVIPSGDGGFMASGWTDTIPNGTLREILLSKLDSSGTPVWTMTYGGSGDDLGFDFEQTSGGGYLLAGQSTSFSPGMPDLYLIHTDNNGGLLWSKTYGSTGEDVLYACHETPDSGFIAGGITLGFGASSYKSYLVKTNFQGFSSCYELLAPATQSAPVTLPVTHDSYLYTSFTVFDYFISFVSGIDSASASLLCATNDTRGAYDVMSLQVFPNPFTQEIQIDFANVTGSVVLSVYDAFGKLILQENVPASCRVSTSEWPAGVYFICLKNRAGTSVKKLIKF